MTLAAKIPVVKLRQLKLKPLKFKNDFLDIQVHFRIRPAATSDKYSMRIDLTTLHTVVMDYWTSLLSPIPERSDGEILGYNTGSL